MSDQVETKVVTKEEKETKKFPWAWVIGAILVLIAIWGLWKMVEWQSNRYDARMQAAYKAAYQEAYQDALDQAVAEMQPVVNDDKEVVKNETIGSNPGDDTYFPELSCSDLASCTMSEVPEGYFTIGFTGTAEGCDWVLFNEGDTIDFTGLDEIHTYNALLPLTRLEGFVRSQTPWVFACQIH